MEQKLNKYILMRNKISPLTVSELRYKLNNLPAEFDDLEVMTELAMAPVYFIRKETEDNKTYLLLATESDEKDIFEQYSMQDNYITNNVEIISNAIELSEWTEEGQKEIGLVARIIDNLSKDFTKDNIETFADFTQCNSQAHLIICAFVERKLNLMNGKTDFTDKPISFFGRERKEWKKYLKFKGYEIGKKEAD